jgi:hypothetical protein
LSQPSGQGTSGLIAVLKIARGKAEGVAVDQTTVDVNVETWLVQLGDRVSVSASRVQDGLLDLWGLLPEGDARQVVEEWLTETLERELYRTEDVIERLERVRALQGEPSSVG